MIKNLLDTSRRPDQIRSDQIMYFLNYSQTKGHLERRLLDETDYEARHRIKCDIHEHNTRFLVDFKKYMCRKGMALRKKSRLGFYVLKRIFYQEYGNRLYWKSQWGHERSIQIYQIRGLKQIDDQNLDSIGYDLVISMDIDENSAASGLFIPALSLHHSAAYTPGIYREVTFRFEFEEDRDLLHDSIQLLMVH